VFPRTFSRFNIIFVLEDLELFQGVRNCHAFIYRSAVMGYQSSRRKICYCPDAIQKNVSKFTVITILNENCWY
jgi:hypothetical protein